MNFNPNNPDIIKRIDDNHVALGFHLDTFEIEVNAPDQFDQLSHTETDTFYYCESCGVDFAEHEVIECFEIDNSYYICPDCKIEVYNHDDYIF
jgi:hypothetical protein